jgi:hypothetical protein
VDPWTASVDYTVVPRVGILTRKVPSNDTFADGIRKWSGILCLYHYYYTSDDAMAVGSKMTRDTCHMDGDDDDDI